MGCVPIVSGKTKMLDELYVVRQVHSARFQNPNPLYSVILSEWHTSYKMLVEIVVDKIYSVTEKPDPSAIDLVNRSFLNYFSKVVNSKFCRKDNGILSKLKRSVRQHFPIFEKIYFKYLIPGTSLSVLYSRKFKHHNDFMKVANFINKEQSCSS